MKLKCCLVILATVLATQLAFSQDVQKIYDEKGNLKSTVPMVNGKKHGIEKNYYRGYLFSEIPYKDGKREGVAKTYWSNGNIQSTRNYVNDVEEGVYRGYYYEGGLQNEIPMVNGERHGVTKSYFKNGKLSIETPMVDGWIDGVTREYREDGSLKSEVGRKRSSLDGLSIEYYENGSVKSEALYKMGTLQGVVKEYAINQKTASSNLCPDLEKVIDALRQGKLSGLVDYKKPLGFTRSWYEAIVPLAGFKNLKGQSLFSNLSFVGTLVNGYGDGKEKMFEEITQSVSNCLTGYSKKVDKSDSSVRFTTFESRDKKITVRLEYSYSGNDEKGIYIEIRN